MIPSVRVIRGDVVGWAAGKVSGYDPAFYRRALPRHTAKHGKHESHSHNQPAPCPVTPPPPECPAVGPGRPDNRAPAPRPGIPQKTQAILDAQQPDLHEL